MSNYEQFQCVGSFLAHRIWGVECFAKAFRLWKESPFEGVEPFESSIFLLELLISSQTGFHLVAPLDDPLVNNHGLSMYGRHVFSPGETLIWLLSDLRGLLVFRRLHQPTGHTS